MYAVPSAYAIFGSLGTLVGSPRQEANIYLNFQYSTRFLEKLVSAGGTQREVLIKEFLLEREREGGPSLAGLIGQLSAVARHYISRKTLRNLKKQLNAQGSPILLMTGTEDHLVRPLNSFILKEVLDAKLIVFTGCGHMIHMEKPELFNSLLLEHFEAAAPSNAARAKL